MAFYPIALVLCVLAAALLARPLWWPFGSGGKVGLTDEVEVLGRQLRQLQELHRAGALGDEQYAQSKEQVERKLLAAASGAPAAPIVATRASPGLAAALVVFMFAVAGAGYHWLGSPANLEVGPGTVATAGGAAGAAQGDGAAAAHSVTPEQVTAMIDKLAERLKARPDDAEGWQMLARSYVVIGKHAQAVDAFKEAARLSPADATLLADYADALAMANNRSLEGEPAKLIDRALKIDAKNPKALALAGTIAFDKRDYKGAVRYWETLAQSDTADNSYAQQIQGSIAEARQLAGMPPATLPASSAAAVTTASASASAKVDLRAQVSGTVTLARNLSDRVKPEDTLFVFARSVEGQQRMPLAVLRKRVSDLPLQFTIDDSLAMSPEAKLSSASRVVVVARISKSGNASPQAGDLEGLASGVVVGSSGLKLEINQEVTR